MCCIWVCFRPEPGTEGGQTAGAEEGCQPGPRYPTPPGFAGHPSQWEGKGAGFAGYPSPLGGDTQRSQSSRSSGMRSVNGGVVRMYDSIPKAPANAGGGGVRNHESSAI